MHEPPSACPVCGAPAARATAVLELDLGDADHDVAVDGVPFAVRRRLPRRGRRWVLGALGALGLTALVANALVDDGSARPAVLPATVTTAAEPATTSVPTPAGPLFGETTGLQLVVLAAPDLAVVDLDAATTTPLDTDVVARSAGGPAVATSRGLAFADRAGAASVLAPGAATSRAVLTPAAGRRVTAVLGEGPVGQLWVVLGGDAGADEVGVVDLAGDGTFSAVGSLPAGAVARADGVGGAVVGAPGGVYRLLPGQAPTRLTGGVLLDARAGHVLSLECDDALACAWQVLDPADGSRWRVAVPPAGEAGTVRLAPDGRRLVRATPGADRASVALELVGADGAVVHLAATILTCGDAGCDPTVSWSADGRWLVGVNPGGQLWGWRDGWTEPVVAPVPGHDGRPLTVGALLTVTAPGEVPGRPT